MVLVRIDLRSARVAALRAPFFSGDDDDDDDDDLAAGGSSARADETEPGAVIGNICEGSAVPGVAMSEH